MWHAGAATSEGRWAGPTVGVEAAVATGSAVAAEENEANAMTEPIFKPFVMARIPLPSGYTYGEVLGLNESNQAVGWMHHDSENRDHAFFFDPADGVTILPLSESLHDASWAYSISDDSTPVIAGAVMWKGSPNYLRACTWTGPTGDLEVPFATGVVSTAYAINDVSSTTTLAGMCVVSSESRSVVYDGNFEYPAPGAEGEARGMNGSGKVIGWHVVSNVSHAYSWVSDTTTDIHPNGYDASAALCVNSAGHIGGWVDDNGAVICALWTPLFAGVYTLDPFDAGADSAVTAINSSGEMAIMRSDATPGAAIWSKRTGVDDADLLDDLTMTPDGDDVLHSAWAINDNGWIGGSYLAGGTGDPQPCLVIPYDVNNDGTPDYRQILEGKRQGFTDLDTNNNWLLDWAEQMRSGLHAPGHPDDDSTGSITGVQAIRVRVGLKQRDGAGLGEGEDIIYIDEVVQSTPDCVACESLTDLLNQWGTGSHYPSDPKQSETIVWVRSLLEEDISGWGNHDALPANATDRQEALEDIRDFAYRFARCIDYLQWGNEVFGGQGGYKFRNSDLSCTITDGTEFEGLPETCKEEAADKVLEWIEAQMLAAREGSALASRPNRMIGPGIPSGPVRGGYDDEGPGRYITTETINLCNRHNMYFSMHVHYQTVAEAEESIKKLVDTWQNPPAAPWDVPEFKVATEWGPMADFPAPNHIGDEWWTSGSPFTNKVIYERFFDDTTEPGESWDSFVGRWEGDSQSFGDEAQEFPGFRFDDVLDWFDAAGFTAVCYGPSLQHEPDPNPGPYNVAGLCTNWVDAAWEEPYFSTLRTRYQNAVSNGGFVITPFEPHESAVPTSETCPDCE